MPIAEKESFVEQRRKGTNIWPILCSAFRLLSGTTSLACHSEPWAKNLDGVGVAIFCTRNVKRKRDPSATPRMTLKNCDLN